MTKYEDSIYLRSKTRTGVVADCIFKTFSNFGIDFPSFKTNLSQYCFKFEVECGSVYFQQDNKTMDFRFNGFINDCEDCITIRYNEAENRLDYAETFTTPRFLLSFFNNCRGLLRKCLFPDVISVNRNIFDYCSEINPVDIKNDELRVTFYADENGELLFPQEWMEQLSKDFYFLNINHRYDKGLSTFNIYINDINKEKILKELCSCIVTNRISVEKRSEPLEIQMQSNNSQYEPWQQVRNRAKGNIWNQMMAEGGEDFDSFFKHSCERRKRELKEKFILSPDAKIIIESQEGKNEITKDNFRCASYDEFCMLMINEVLKLRKSKAIANDSAKETFIPCESNDKNKIENQNLKKDLQKARKAIEALQEQNKEFYDELIDLKSRIPSDNLNIKGSSENDDVISELRSENHDLRETIKRLEQDLNGINAKTEPGSNGFITLSIPCSEVSLFKNEIEDYCYGLLYSAFEYEQQHLPQNRDDEKSRKADVIADILVNRKFDWKSSWTFRQITGIETVLKSSRTPSLNDLSKYGFIPKPKYKKHSKCCFYDERYQVTISLTPSDCNFSNVKMKEIKARCFLIPVKQGSDSDAQNVEPVKKSA